MLIKKLIFITFFICLILFSCTSIQKLNYAVTEKRHTPAELIKDVDLAYKLLTKGHPGVYWFIEKKQLDISK